tara:strand:+ start:30016 stop:30324 length:309 start_codon:yes stop_codon:yes gene_type:complete
MVGGISTGCVTVDPSEEKSRKTSRFTDPLPGFKTTFTVAAVASEDAICDGARVGLATMKRAIIPATCGAAIDVPLIVLLADGKPIQEDVINDPGANTSRHAP